MVWNARAGTMQVFQTSQVGEARELAYRGVCSSHASLATSETPGARIGPERPLASKPEWISRARREEAVAPSRAGATPCFKPLPP